MAAHHSKRADSGAGGCRVTTATAQKRVAAKRRKTASVGFARAIEASAEGVAPTAARLWRAGWNKTDKGDLKFTPRSAKLVMQAFGERGNPLAFYYEHEDRIPLAQRGGSPMKGVCSAPSSRLAIRDGDGGAELWAEEIAWTAEAKRQIETGERRQISPIAAFDEETREIIRIENVSLCAEGATHFGTLLASAGKEEKSMDELIQKLLSACDAGDFEMAKQIIAELEAMEGGGPAAMMGKALVAKYAAGNEKKDPPADDVATKKLAASPTMAASRTAPTGLEAFSREMAELRSATAAAQREAKVGRVEGIILANRDVFDAVDEREHLAAADPERTRKHVESIRRKIGEGGLLAASKDNGGGVRPPGKPPEAKDDAASLSDIERAVAGQHGVDEKRMAERKAQLAKSRRR